MLALREVSVAYDGVPVLDGVSLDVAEREIVALLGPSGSGKSTLLRVVAGIVTPDAGRVAIDRVDVTGVPTHQRSVGMVFQDDQLFPHLDVGRNVAFGLRMAGISRADRRHRVEAMLDLVGLSGFAARSIDGLSGGEAKRVALARSLAPAPRALMLDEPLTGLDRELQQRLARDVEAVIRTTGTTALWVTHDADEAALVADRVVQLADLSGDQR